MSSTKTPMQSLENILHFKWPLLSAFNSFYKKEGYYYEILFSPP